MKAMLKEKTMHRLMELAMEVDEDVTSCESKDELIQIRLASEKSTPAWWRNGGRHAR
ncbi:unnamed protein product [Ectocarpus sp. 12 AP-2014]